MEYTATHLLFFYVYCLSKVFEKHFSTSGLISNNTLIVNTSSMKNIRKQYVDDLFY